MIDETELQPAEPLQIEPIRISPMRHSDIEAVARLERICQPLPWSANAYTTELNNPNAYYAAAKSADGDLAGYGGIWVIMDEMHVTNLATKPALRGRKIAERLLVVLIREGIARGATRATLEVRESNLAAQGLYKKFGFLDVAMRKQYYSDNRENAYIMWAEDLTGDAYQQMLALAEARLFPKS
ncbi:MAG: ribosomal protein S18-alanine N-acetyltransferase [Capsulimonadaceae bacterium]|nr:ribosomal protein S18-alanine N-acetyltransferase [Capsulimonadaceae bacterium]